MIEKLISPGDKLELRSTVSVVLPDGTEGVRTYKSSVYDVLEDGKLELLMPMEQQKLVLLPVDGEYDVRFLLSGGMYRANMRIVDRQKINNTYIVVAEMLSNLHKYQRREYYRFNCVIEMDVRELNDQETEAHNKGLSYMVSEEEVMNRGVIVDISGGGLRFVSRQIYQAGSVLLLRFSLPVQDVEKSFLVAARVIYSGEIEKRKAEYENRVKFELISSAMREEIIKYIFNAERKNRKNGRS